MIDRQHKGRDCRDGAWFTPYRRLPPRRSLERLAADYWRMTASYIDTW